MHAGAGVARLVDAGKGDSSLAGGLDVRQLRQCRDARPGTLVTSQQPRRVQGLPGFLLPANRTN